MAQGTRYEPSRAGLAALAVSPDILAACVAEAERGKKFAEGISPRSTEEARQHFADVFGADQEHRHYGDSFEVIPTTFHLAGRPRAGAVLVNTARHSPAVEFGNVRTPRPHRVVGKTAAYLGSGG